MDDGDFRFSRAELQRTLRRCRLLSRGGDSVNRFAVRFWGVRGSVATSGRNSTQVGGNTSCVEVRAGKEIIILNGGTRLARLGE